MSIVIDEAKLSLCHLTDVQDGQSEVSSCTGHASCVRGHGLQLIPTKENICISLICQTTIARKGNVERHFRAAHEKFNTDL